MARVPEKETAPPPLCAKAPPINVEPPKVRERGPLLAIAKGPVPAVATVLLMVKFAPVKEIPEAPVVVILPEIEVRPVPDDCVIVEADSELVVRFPTLVMSREAKGVVIPTAPAKVMSPVPTAKVKSWALSTVPPKVTLSPFKLAALVKTAFCAKEIAPPAEKEPAMLFEPAPLCIKAPSIE